ncbi:MAG: hypothetical protein A2Y62_02640 [Candidatus Fischerbacteria bacterium RBG_13_37_8]|uniref:Uncharacterized protein n=1 Tax=Candidatus Fischerbacteria bacterium RBG_13_37_8 TaxID=1817863 RepID=A0A1F5VRZ3_9BACT|nr:MAG: hypothetical protein A2Y62_02640 [Candidatus Fischerbacteria bacterium RBG_13_37_8]
MKSRIVILVIIFGMLFSCSRSDNPVQPDIDVREVQFSGRVTGTFSGGMLVGARVQVQIEGQGMEEVMTDTGGRYNAVLRYERDRANPKVERVIYRASGSVIRFARETSYRVSMINDVMEYDFNCIENYGDGANFDLKLYRKLNSQSDGAVIPTMRWYPDFPEVYIVKTPDISNWQYQQVKEGIQKISQYSRGAIPLLQIHTVTEEPNGIDKGIIHKWDKITKTYCATTTISLMPNFNILNYSTVSYKKGDNNCSKSSSHEMLHAMMGWEGLDKTNSSEITDYQLSLQIFFTYKRYPKHTLVNSVDTDSKPW